MKSELPVSSLFGRRVVDARGQYIGRLVEMEARIELHAGGSDYVVRTCHVSHYGPFDAIAGSILVQQLVERLGERAGYCCHHIAAEKMDFTSQPIRVLADQASSTST